MSEGAAAVRPAPRVSVLVLAYGDEPWLARCVRSALASEDVHAEVVLVDNGADAAVVSALENLDRVTVVRPGTNTGFAGGCNLAAQHAAGDVLVLLNDDAVVAPGALTRLAAALESADVGAACASVRLAGDEGTINTSGNPLHFTGLSWAGGHGRPASELAAPRDVPVAAGTCLAVRRDVWTTIGGLWEAYFAYHEDVDLSRRLWMQGMRCVYVPDAVAVHRYEFSRNRTKNYLLERNRLLFLLTTFERRSLALLAPALLLVELGMLVLSTSQGWLRAKLAGYRWLMHHRTAIRRRRAQVQQQRVVADHQLVHLLSARIDPRNAAVSPAMRVLDVLLRAYWRLVRGSLSRP